MKILKRLFAALILVAVLCSCGAEEARENNGYGRPKISSAAGEVKSSIFGQSVSYNGFTPKEGLTLPVEADEISGVLEIEKRLYILSGGGVYYLDLESGEAGKLIDTAAEIIATDGTNIFTYQPETGELREFSPSGEIISNKNININEENFRAQGLYVTENYFAFRGVDSSSGVSVVSHIVYDRETLEKINGFSEEKSFNAASAYRVFGRYKGDEILKIERNASDERFVNIFGIDLKSGKSKKLATVEISGSASEIAFTYREKTDTMLIFAAPSTRITPVKDFTPFLIECSLDDPDNILLRRFYLDEPAVDRAFLTVFENAVSIIVSPGGYISYDFLDPPESVTLACTVAEQYGDIIKKFEKETGITVKTVSYGLDFERLDIKLMAGDRDFDIYEPIAMYQTKYFLAGMFEDLSQFDGLKKRLSGDLAADYISKLDGKYIGVPTSISNFTSRKNFSDDQQSGWAWSYPVTVSKYAYFAQNVDLTEGRFDDPQGDKLYKLLKYICDKPDLDGEKMPFGSELFLMNAGFLVMNPNSENKDNAAKFLEYVFDCRSGAAEGFEPRYVSVDSTEGIYIYWKCFSPEYTNPALEACTAAAQSDGKSAALRQLASEAAGKVRMRMGG